MKSQIVLLGAFLCFGLSAQTQTANQNTKSTQSANRIKRSVPGAQSLTGCVDQQNGHYVLRDVKTDQLLTLQAPRADADDYFARFVGHQVQATGTESSGTLKVSAIGQVADMCGTGK